MSRKGFNVAAGLVAGVLWIGMASVTWAGGPGCRSEGSSVSGRASHGLHGHRTAGHMLRHLLKHKHDLALSDEQIGKLRAMALEYDRTGIRGEAEVMVAERELRALLWDEKAELNAIEAKVKEREALEASVRIVGIRARRELVNVLTPEQRTKLKALWEQRHQGHRHAMQRAETAETAEANRVTDDGLPEMEFQEAREGVSAG